MADITVDALRKINDFKLAYKVAFNPYENKAVDEIIDAIFENIRCYYEQYNDSIQRVPTTMENYKYHLIKPRTTIAKDTREIQYYPLLDFLINRAVSNLDGMEITDGNSEYKNRRIIFNPDGFREYERYKNPDLTRRAQAKTMFKETGKVLCNYDFLGDPTLHTSLDSSKPSGYTPVKKIGSFIGCLGDTYIDMLTVDEVIKAPISKNYNNNGRIPFNSGVLALTAQEYYSTKFAKMFGRENIKFYKPLIAAHININKKNQAQDNKQDQRQMVVLTPNSLSRFAGGGRFFYHLENLTSKKAMFLSMFFGKDDAIIEFANKYRDGIDAVWKEFYQSKGETTDKPTAERLKSLFINACDMTKTEDKQKNMQRYISQRALDMVFLKAYQKAEKTKQIPGKDLEKIFKESFAISPVICDPATGQCKDSEIREAYAGAIKRVEFTNLFEITDGFPEI